MKLEKVPNASWKKAAIIKWLESKGKTTDMTMLKAELLQSVALIKDNFNKYVIAEKAHKRKNTTKLYLDSLFIITSLILSKWYGEEVHKEPQQYF